jgi:hypothetical protein
MKSPAVFLLAVVVLCGCRAQPDSTTQPTTREFTLIHNPPTAPDARDPTPVWQALVHLDVYQFDVPVGQISQNEKFWKQIDETRIGADLSQRLFQNGVRCGIVPKTDWSFFHNLIQDKSHPAVHQTIDGFRSDDGVQLPLTRPVDSEDIFFVNSTGDLEGHTYKNCVNELDLSFEPVARRPGALRIALCPTVQQQAKRLEYTLLNHEVEAVRPKADRLYDTAVLADVPDDSFLIVSAGPLASRTTSIGGSFFIKNDNAQQFEQVLLIVPTFLQFDGKPITVSSDALPSH